MRRFLRILIPIAALSAASAEPVVVSMEEAGRKPGLRCELSGNGRDQLTLTIANDSGGEIRADVPAGLICATLAGDRMIVLRSAQLAVAAGAAAEALLPAVALSSKNAHAASAHCRATAGTEPRLAPLLKYLATRADVPRTTTQLAALALLENITFAQWQHFLAPQRAAGEAHPTPAEVAQAIDALGILREIAPEKSFALAADAELKLRALRNPWCRAKAMQLYGMTLPGEAGAAPDLSQLLHAKPGDNCPICRMRQRSEQSAGDL